MFKLRSEVHAVARACEHLISEIMMKGQTKLTDDECQVLDYYAGELAKITATNASIQPAIPSTLHGAAIHSDEETSP